MSSFFLSTCWTESYISSHKIMHHKLIIKLLYNFVNFYVIWMFSNYNIMCNETDLISKYDNLMKHLSWISISTWVDLTSHDLVIFSNSWYQLWLICVTNSNFWNSLQAIWSYINNIDKIDYIIIIKTHIIWKDITCLHESWI